VSVQENTNTCRFIIKMVCNQGVIKTYKLTYEAVDVMHALFDRTTAKNRWSMRAGGLREYVEYFGAKTEMLDIFSGEEGEGRAVFKSFTEKISNGKEVLKHPLVTAVAVNTSDFEEFSVQPGLHIIISVKDFKAIVVHADTLKTSLQAFYSYPTRPLQFSYGGNGLLCEFTLMTSGAYNGPVATPTPAPQIPSRLASRAQSAGTETRSMPPPTVPASRRSTRRLSGSRRAASPKPQPDPESLFVNQDEDDARWEPLNYNQEEEEMLGWDASADRDGADFPTFRDSESFSRQNTTTSTTPGTDSFEGIAPSQRASQVQGLW
jgi:cell cycle checkpoint control protein RAD9A